MERAVMGWLGAFSWPAAEAARAAATIINPLEREGKAAERPVAPAPKAVFRPRAPAAAPATLAAAGEPARRIAAGTVTRPTPSKRRPTCVSGKVGKSRHVTDWSSLAGSKASRNSLNGFANCEAVFISALKVARLAAGNAALPI